MENSTAGSPGVITPFNHNSQDDDAPDDQMQELSISETSRPKDTDGPLKKQHIQLVRNGKKLADSIVRALAYVQDVDMALRRTLEDDSYRISIEKLAQILHEWSAINSAFREAILDTKDLAVRSAGFVSLFLSVCFPSTGRANNVTLKKFKDDNTHRELHSLTEKVHGEYFRVMERMAKFKENFVDDTSHQTRSILSIVDNAEKTIAHIVNPLPPLSVKQTTLLDNSSIPGLMTWIIAFLPNKSTFRIDEFIEGKRATITQSREASGQHGMSSMNMFTCLLDVGHMIPADLSITLKFPLTPMDQKKWDYAVQSTYTFLEVSLKEFDESLTAAVTPAKSSTMSSVGRWRWASNMQLYFHQFIHLVQTPLRFVY